MVVDRFYVLSAELHILSFHLFKHRSAIEASILQNMFHLACTIIELADSLDRSLGLAEYGPTFLLNFLLCAAIVILRLDKDVGCEDLDRERGRKAYFVVINFHKKHSVRFDDAFARLSTILTQLWTSTRIFRYADGTVDSLHIRSKARLGMSMVYDCFWWWRQDFSGQEDIYEGSKGMLTLSIQSSKVLHSLTKKSGETATSKALPKPTCAQGTNEPTFPGDNIPFVDTTSDLPWPLLDNMFCEEWHTWPMDINGGLDQTSVQASRY